MGSVHVYPVVARFFQLLHSFLKDFLVVNELLDFQIWIFARKLFQNLKSFSKVLIFILKLISLQATDKNAAILLDGYVELHKQTCNKEDCPLKQKNMKSNMMHKN